MTQYRAVSTLTTRSPLSAVEGGEGEILGYLEPSGSILRPGYILAVTGGSSGAAAITSDEGAPQLGISRVECVAVGHPDGDRSGQCEWYLDGRIEAELPTWFEPPYEGGLGWIAADGCIIRPLPVLERIREGRRVEMMLLGDGAAHGVEVPTWSDATVERADDTAWVDEGMEEVLRTGFLAPDEAGLMRWVLLAGASRERDNPDFRRIMSAMMASVCKGAAMASRAPACTADK
jgi:hypothetical protein